MIRFIACSIFVMLYFIGYSQVLVAYDIYSKLRYADPPVLGGAGYNEYRTVSSDSFFNHIDSALQKATWVKYLHINGDNFPAVYRQEKYPNLNLDSIFCKMINLKYLIISHYNIEEVSDCFANLDELEYLIITQAKFDTLPTPITHLKNLEYLVLNNQEKSFKGIGSLKNLNHLKMGVIDSNCKDVDELFKLREMKYLDVIVPNLPNGISKLKDLEYLDIATPNISKDLGKLSKLNYLEVRRTDMSYVPNTFYKFKVLEHLRINHCDFVNDTFPTDFYKFKNLKNMNINFYISQIRIPEDFRKKAKEVFSDFDEY